MVLPRNMPEPDERIYLIGESHLLPLSWQQLQVYGRSYIMVPKLIMGLKAWLFSSKASLSKEMATLEWHLETLPDNSFCIVVAGEIDCRHGIGIYG